ncbi:MAG: thrombospondin type 3 repeat-containing protein [Phycisphaerae bacterium]
MSDTPDDSANTSANANDNAGPRDTDGDGVPDAADTCPTVPDPDQSDLDGDGIGDACDNCPDDPNPDQADINFNRIGDACDADPWLAAAGVYALQGDCEDDDGLIAVVRIGQVLLLRAFDGSDDIPLSLNGAVATADNVTQSGVDGFTLTMTIHDTGTVTLELVRPTTGDTCTATLTPQ